MVAEFGRRHAAALGTYFDPDGKAMETVRQRGLFAAEPERLPVPPPVAPVELAHRIGAAHAAFRAALAEIFAHRMGGSWQKLAEDLRLGETTRRYVDVRRPPLWARFGRPDIVVHGDHVTMVEPNVGTSCGALADADILGRLFEDAPLVGDLLRGMGARRRDVLGAVAEAVGAALREHGQAPDALVAVTEFAADLADAGPHYEALAAELRGHGLRAEVAAVEDLECGPAGVRLAGVPCGAIYRLCGEEPDPVGHLPFLRALFASARAGRVAVVDALDDQIAGHKTILAVVSEELDAGRVAAEQAAVLDGFVPWTRIFEDGPATFRGERVDLVPWTLAHQQDLVLKPGAGYQGRGVTLGCETAPEQWQALIGEALGADEAWMVQSLARSAATDVSVSRAGGLFTEETFVEYGYYAVAGAAPAAAIRRSAPIGRRTRKIKQSTISPLFFV
ncbi:hypothetical protein IAG44_40670 [Streptomyces roseirectus]|uniref:Glutathionylspermidine synthase pre-ATP-grasp-like domain-containing protein n=1 Tax=Streptomyces roseirectus TaxID=2768066 RepID=A0A7H0IQP0_9ACTN|nr:hypothetical protein [Streptomyces roseirectus]QNP75106.1 hypothetical protein IAG44_40670 [Streptomyces roseirectus]